LSHQNDIPEAQPGVLLDAVSGRLGDAASTVLADVRALRSGTVIYAGSTIGAGLETGHNVVIREENEIGAELSIWSNSSLDYGCTVGNPARVIGTVAELGERLDREGVWPPDDLPPKGETSPA
jgi:acetyltransferase-like isoleucine patch superfamily enzyme